MTDQRLQTEKPMCSESTEKSRLRPAMARPLAFQKSRSSGRQSSIQWPPSRLGVRVVETVCWS